MSDPEELLAALDDAEIIGTVTDALGDFVKVGVIETAVLIGISGSPGILDTPERCDEFARYWMEACRQVEAVEAARAAGTEAGAGNDGEDCGCGLGAERCRAAEDGDLGD